MCQSFLSFGCRHSRQFFISKTDRLSRRTIKRNTGSGCGSLGRAVTFDTIGPWFDSSHWQNFIEHLFVNLFIINCIEKTKINEKEAGNSPLLKNKKGTQKGVRDIRINKQSYKLFLGRYNTKVLRFVDPHKETKYR